MQVAAIAESIYFNFLAEKNTIPYEIALNKLIKETGTF